MRLRALTTSTLLLAGAVTSDAEPFVLPLFPVGISGETAYTAPMIAVLDHAGTFYTNCCDDTIVAFSGETGHRADGALGCPEPQQVPQCFFGGPCICAYGHPEGGVYELGGSYVGSFGGPSYLLYDGHAGYDYAYAAGTPLIAPLAGMLCKARDDLVNGHAGFPTPWDKFHTYFIDHGVHDGLRYSTWYLHASDLETPALRALAPGECAAVAQGEIVARVGNQGTLAPHLHFEVRATPPDAGPEDRASRVVDPYGFSGPEPDPWEDPDENPQALHRSEPIWSACGNGRLEDGETCDDGNARDGDCCSARCSLEAPGSPCGAGDPCTLAACDGTGSCEIQGTLACEACAWCDPERGCVTAPATGCRAAARSTLRLRRGGPSGAGDRLAFGWRRGAATAPANLGNPGASDALDLCLYDGAGALLLAARAPAAASCPPGPTGGPCWKARGSPPGSRGYRYRDAAAAHDGLVSVSVKPGREGRSRVAARGRGAGLGLPALPLALPVRAQLRSTAGACWEAGYSETGLRRNDGGRFRAVAD